MARSQIKRNRRAITSLVIALATTIIGSCIVNFYLVAHLDHSGSVVGTNGAMPPTSSAGNNNRQTKRNANDATQKASASHTRTRSNATEHRNTTDMFREAGVELDEESIRRLPTWEQIESIIGQEPAMIGSEMCADFRSTVPPLRSMLGSAGMFNSGTNLVTRLMKENCVIPERYNKYGSKARKEQTAYGGNARGGSIHQYLLLSLAATFSDVGTSYAHTVTKSENITRDDCMPIVNSQPL